MPIFKNLIVALIVIAGSGALLWYATLKPPTIIQGEVSADRYNISARQPGRVTDLKVDVGDELKAGEVVAVLESPELQSKLRVREAQLEVAKAELERVRTIRPEDVAARKAELEAAKADVVLQRQTFERIAKLEKQQTASEARLDKETRDLDAAIKKRQRAQAAYERTVCCRLHC